MVFGETGVGKSAWLHCFLNYLQGIQIEENNRYYLFNEKQMRLGCNLLDKPAIYNIESTIAFNNPIRLIDTPGYGDLDLEGDENRIIKDIQDLLTKEIETLNAICLIFKANCKVNYHTDIMVNKLFSLFGKEIKKNIILIFTFVSDYNDLPTLNYLKNEKHFFKFLDDINELSHFEFNNRAYFSYNKEEFSNIFEKNTKNYNKLLKYVFTLKQISLKSSQEVVKNRFNFANYILNVCNELLDIIVKINISIKKRDGINKLIQNLEENKKCDYKQIKVSKSYQVPYEEIYKENLSHGWYALYCNNCNKICHRDCKGVNEGNHSNENGCLVMDILNDKCSYCNCHYQKHKFHDYIEKKRIVYRSEIYEAIEYDPKSISSEKE
jgi:hypothetical protein